ncbi:hypothetical protein EDD16DRAFT_1525169 [Pisolithus croceorrhizus]|nr:hypothetical protein EDD16DRAFT_1525169 [Pisolithus croceorrhizus]KAI6107266.1 hypothetical protein EV401DRAFT_1892178 [Pisolithus croceorrhizus]KAI6162760.1 hypothetical protein EDD17DRAFT_1507646 [Pisolithus thermaeus]
MAASVRFTKISRSEQGLAGGRATNFQDARFCGPDGKENRNPAQVVSGDGDARLFSTYKGHGLKGVQVGRSAGNKGNLHAKVELAKEEKEGNANDVEQIYVNSTLNIEQKTGLQCDGNPTWNIEESCVSLMILCKRTSKLRTGTGHVGNVGLVSGQYFPLNNLAKCRAMQFVAGWHFTASQVLERSKGAYLKVTAVIHQNRVQVHPNALSTYNTGTSPP